MHTSDVAGDEPSRRERNFAHLVDALAAEAQGTGLRRDPEAVADAARRLERLFKWDRKIGFRGPAGETIKGYVAHVLSRDAPHLFEDKLAAAQRDAKAKERAGRDNLSPRQRLDIANGVDPEAMWRKG